ncbi:unnamed protein product [Larinioides sclopetarius]|uniref:MADF domain-containing protein n=1 Tax=Larinioides sclopetarius TaxID=280406 RepID=A0AAV2BRH3_9ARAC
MEWPEEFSLKLIQAYRKKRLLWDVTHKSHYKKNLKADAWKEISDEMNVSVILCQKKMLSLQSSYRRERKKVNCFKAAGKQGVESSWFGYEAFKFLEDEDLPQKEYTLETDKIIKIEDDIEAEVLPLYEMEQETVQTEQQIERHHMSQCLLPLHQPEQETERRPMSQVSMPLWQLEQETERRSMSHCLMPLRIPEQETERCHMPQCLMPLRIPEQETERCHMPQCLMPLRLPEQETKCRPMDQPMPIISTVSSISRSTKRHREKGDCINSSKMTNAIAVLDSKECGKRPIRTQRNRCLFYLRHCQSSQILPCSAKKGATCRV